MVSFIYYIILVCKFTYVGTLGNSSDNNSSNSSQQNTNRNKESVEERLDALMKKAKFNNNSNHSTILLAPLQYNPGVSCLGFAFFSLGYIACYHDFIKKIFFL